MLIHRVKITKVAGVESLDFQPDKINVFEGKNESGKSSALKAIRSCLPPNMRVNYGTLTPDDADFGETVIYCDEDTEIERKVTHGDKAADSPLTVRRGKRWKETGSKAFDFIADRFDTIMFCNYAKVPLRYCSRRCPLSSMSQSSPKSCPMP